MADETFEILREYAQTPIGSCVMDIIKLASVERHKKNTALSAGRNLANKERRERGAGKKEAQRAAALKIWKENPTLTKEQVAQKILDRYASGKVKSGDGGAMPYKLSYIMNNIKGVREQAFREYIAGRR